MFHSKSKLAMLPGGGVRISIDLCPQCMNENIKMTDMMCPQMKKKAF
jgi:hypothetical protein